ncbi:MAG TPA: FtsX-like permease family protein, partial [Tepidiformaceae bacterium]|nr:FtsX-like permease family protein [Tepidiformaceae bacterium]
MRRVLLKKGWADLRSRKLQSLLAAVIIAAAAALGVLSVSITQSASSTYSSVLDQAHGGHAWVLSNDAAPLVHLADIQGVVAASGPFARADATLTSTVQTHSLVLWGMDKVMPAVAPALVRQGHWLDGGTDEAVIDRGLADKAGLSVGSSLTVSGSGGSRTLRVVGIGVNTTDAPYPLSDPADVFTSPDIVQSVSGGHLDAYGGGVRLANPDATQGFIAAFARASGQSADLRQSGVTWQSIRDQIGSGDKALVILLRTFAVFAFFAVGFVLANAVSGQVLSQYRDIGLLRAAGLTPRQVTMLLLVEQLVLAVLAATAGAVLGVFATPLALGRVSNLLDTTPPDPFNPAVMALVVAAVTLEVLLFTAVPAWRGGRVSTVQALTVGPSQAATRPSRLAAWSQQMRLPAAAVIGLKDLFSRPGRAWLSVAALVLAFSTVASALTIESTVRAISDDPLRIGRPPYQLELTAAALDGSSPLSDSAIRADALAQPGVQSIVTIQRLPGTVDGGDSYFDVDALSGDLSKMPYPIVSGRMLAGPGEAVIALNVA